MPNIDIKLLYNKKNISLKIILFLSRNKGFSKIHLLEIFNPLYRVYLGQFMSTHPKLKLIYLNVRALAEIPQMIMHYSNIYNSHFGN